MLLLLVRLVRVLGYHTIVIVEKRVIDKREAPGEDRILMFLFIYRTSS